MFAVIGPGVDIALLVVLGLAVVLITRFLLIRGIEIAAWRATPKAKGQILGYATSVPELVATVSTAANGLLGAGLWNVAASNIINMVLFSSALLWYRRHGTLPQAKFVDEIGFALGAIGLPLVLVTQPQWAQSPATGVILFGIFLVYMVADYYLNPRPIDPPDLEKPLDHPSWWVGPSLILGGIIGIVLVGSLMGSTAESVVKNMGVPQVAVGWILGFVSSLPELTSFFTIFATADRGPEGDSDTQQNLDNLAASNMSNLGLIYPIGIAVFIMVTL